MGDRRPRRPSAGDARPGNDPPGVGRRGHLARAAPTNLALLRITLLSLVVLATAACGASHSSAKLVSIGAGLKGAAGLHASVYARGIPNMSAFAFDGRGRLWVTRSGSSTHANDGVYLVAAPGAAPVKVVSSIRGPLGIVWAGHSLYVSYLGGVDRFDGFSGHGFANRKTILKGSAQNGENNNLVLAPDGRFLMGVSAPCDHCPTPPRYSAAIVSFRPDGSGLQLFATRIRAAYGLVLDGSTLYASMNQRDDLGSKTPGDWLAVVEQGQDWGFPACYGQGGSDCAGVPAPLGVLDPHSGAGGVAILGRSALVTEWTFGKVMRVALGNGAVSTWVSGLLHALPLASRPDGSVLVGDWGSGVIYRITGGD